MKRSFRNPRHPKKSPEVNVNPYNLKMIRRPDIPWTRLLIEGVAIVASILLAFAIDAWWDERKDQVEEREILIGLETEFVDLRARLNQWAEFSRKGLALSDQFLSDSVSEMDLRAFEQLFSYALLVNVLDQGGPLDALLSSGRLERISDVTIRARLAKWPDWLDDIRTNDTSIRDFAWREIMPFLAKRGIPDRICPEGQWTCATAGPIPTSYVQLAHDPEFRALWILRRSLMWSTAQDHESARAEADTTIELIRNHLAQLGG